MAIGGIDSSVLLGLYQSQLLSNPSSISASNARVQAAIAAHNKGATANDNPPWNTPTPTNSKQDAKVLSTTNFLDTSKVPLSAGAGADTKMEQDNQKLFALYSAVNTLAYLSKMAQSSTATSGQLAGLNDRFQKGLAQVQGYLTSTKFNKFNIGIKKGGVTTNVVIDMSQVPGTLNLTNVVSYINDQLSTAGFSTRFQK